MIGKHKAASKVANLHRCPCCHLSDRWHRHHCILHPNLYSLAILHDRRRTVRCHLRMGLLTRLATIDFAADTRQILLLSQIEINMAIVCASLPTLRPMAKKVFGSSAATKSETYGPYHKSSSNNGGPRAKRLGGMELGSLGDYDKRATTAIEAQSHRMNSSSEELILGKPGGIYKTKETQVKSERCSTADREMI